MLNKIIDFFLCIFRKGVDIGVAETARFLTSRGQFNSKEVKNSAFLPMLNGGTSKYETSVYVINGLSGEYVKNIGSEVVKSSGRTLYGYAHLEEKHIIDAGLAIDINNTPKHHANIIGWAGEKSERKLQALKLSIKAILKSY